MAEMMTSSACRTFLRPQELEHEKGDPLGGAADEDQLFVVARVEEAARLAQDLLVSRGDVAKARG